MIICFYGVLRKFIRVVPGTFENMKFKALLDRHLMLSEPVKPLVGISGVMALRSLFWAVVPGEPHLLLYRVSPNLMSRSLVIGIGESRARTVLFSTKAQQGRFR